MPNSFRLHRPIYLTTWHRLIFENYYFHLRFISYSNKKKEFNLQFNFALRSVTPLESTVCIELWVGSSQVTCATVRQKIEMDDASAILRLRHFFMRRKIYKITHLKLFRNPLFDFMTDTARISVDQKPYRNRKVWGTVLYCTALYCIALLCIECSGRF